MTAHNTPTDAKKALSAKQLQAVLLLAENISIAATAKTIGVNEKTVDLWKRNPAFMKAIQDVEDQVFNENLKLLKKATRGAISCLIRNMGEKVTPYVQVMSASKLLDQAIELHKVQALEARIVELESALESMPAHD